MLLFCLRFSSHLIKKRPFCCMAFHKCFVSSIVEIIGRVREIIPIQIGLSLSDEISYEEQIYLLMCSSLPSFFLLLLLASFSDSLFLFSPAQTSSRTKKHSKKRSHAHENEQRTALPEKKPPPLAQGSMKFTTFKNMMLHLFASLRLQSS